MNAEFRCVDITKDIFVVVYPAIYNLKASSRNLRTKGANCGPPRLANRKCDQGRTQEFFKGGGLKF